MDYFLTIRLKGQSPCSTFQPMPAPGGTFRFRFLSRFSLRASLAYLNALIILSSSSLTAPVSCVGMISTVREHRRAYQYAFKLLAYDFGSLVVLGVWISIVFLSCAARYVFLVSGLLWENSRRMSLLAYTIDLRGTALSIL